MRYVLIIALLFSQFHLNGMNDTVASILSYDKFIEIVVRHHPISQTADLRLDLGEAILRAARGEFDPKLRASISQKDFENERYYDLVNAGLEIPTWLGTSFNVGYEKNDGAYLNPQMSTPSQGLTQMGLSIPLGQGLFIDKRRAQLRKAKITRNAETSNRDNILNDLLFEASMAYWDWFKAYNALEVYEEGVALATQRLQAVQSAAQFGDRPFIDTLEAGIQVQNRVLSLREAQLSLNNSRLLISTFLWLDGNIPMVLSNTTVPISMESINPTSTETLGDTNLLELINAHPELVMSRLKIEQLEIQEYFQKELLKPRIDLKYNAISNNNNPEFASFENDYTFGIEFEYPILLRKERGKRKIAELNLIENRLKLQSKTQQFIVYANSAINEWDTTFDQINLYEQTVSDYSNLLNAERQLFDAGESSVFLVNSRENGYINAQVKFVDLFSKNLKAETKTKFSLNLLNLEL